MNTENRMCADVQLEYEMRVYGAAVRNNEGIVIMVRRGVKWNPQ